MVELVLTLPQMHLTFLMENTIFVIALLIPSFIASWYSILVVVSSLAIASAHGS